MEQDKYLSLFDLPHRNYFQRRLHPLRAIRNVWQDLGFDGGEGIIFNDLYNQILTISRYSTRLPDLSMLTKSIAECALTESSFKEKNELFATAVAIQSLLFTAGALDMPMDSPVMNKLQPVFLHAARDMGREFSPLFSHLSPRKNDKKYNETYQKGRAMTRKYLPAAFVAAEITDNPEEFQENIINNVTFSHMADISLNALVRSNDVTQEEYNQLSHQVKTMLTDRPEDAINILKTVIPQEDYFYPFIEQAIRIHETSELFNDQQRNGLEIWRRLANEIWMVINFHRSLYENDLSRLDPNARRGVFNPMEEMQSRQYQTALKQTGDPVTAILFTTFHQWKDLAEDLPQLQESQ